MIQKIHPKHSINHQIKQLCQTSNIEKIHSGFQSKPIRPHQSKSSTRLIAETAFYKLLTVPTIQTIIPPIANLIAKKQPPILTPIMDTICSAMFIGGKNLKEATPLINKLNKLGVKTIIDLANEGSQTDINQTFHELISLIQKSGDNRAISGIAVKVSGLAKAKVLQNWNKPGIAHEKEELSHKMIALAKQAKNYNLKLYIDAEQYPIQGAINDISRSLMMKFNTGIEPIIYTTHQTYLKESNELLKQDIEWAKQSNITFGTKIVRGAYLHDTLALNPQSPLVFETKSETDHSFNEAMKLCINHNVHTLIATHNSESLSLLDQLSKQQSKNNVQSAQLLGMRDDLTFSKEKSAKYIPIGNLDDGARLFLTRRLIENSDPFSGAYDEVATRIDELKHRVSINQ